MKTRHDGDCPFYSSLINQNPYDGICCCGYGWEQLRNSGGSEQHLYSQERIDSMPKPSEEEIAERSKVLEELFGIVEE